MANEALVGGAAATGNPWLIGGSILANTLGGLFGGGGGEGQAANLHLVNPGQQALYNLLAQRAVSGAGDFGFGSAAKQAKGQVQQFLADRGVDMNSGFAAGAMGDAFANAAAQDQQNRNQFNLGLLATPLQVAQTAGANLIPGSPSQGWSPGAQEGSWNAWQQQQWLAPTTGGHQWGAFSGPARQPGANRTDYGGGSPYTRSMNQVNDWRNRNGL